jgi:pSer/pThr/pTyr-binding forkhead associated (FHA) protein
MDTEERNGCFRSVVRGKQQGQVYELHQEGVKIGRTSGNDILLADPTVSQRHAQIMCLGDGTYGVEDARSANGVFLNERPLALGTIEPLRDGDRIQLGEVVLLFHDR